MVAAAGMSSQMLQRWKHKDHYRSWHEFKANQNNIARPQGMSKKGAGGKKMREQESESSLNANIQRGADFCDSNISKNFQLDFD